MPDINNFEADLLQVWFLLLPPLITIVLYEFATLNPGCPVLFKILLYPIRMYPGIHFVLHGQHIDQRLLQSFTSSRHLLGK